MTGDERFDRERLRLVLSGVSLSLPIGLLLSSLLLGVFWFAVETTPTATFDFRRVALIGWYIAFIALRLSLVRYAHACSETLSDQASLYRATRILVRFKCCEGLIWGALPWIAAGAGTTPTAIALLIALMAAISSNAVAMLSPLRGLYLALVLPMLALTASRLFLLPGIVYPALGVCCMIYVLGQYWQAKLIGNNINERIRLNFENLDLVARLEQEKAAVSLAREEAVRANQAKSRFLAAASHDLRQPVHALGLFLETLSLGSLSLLQRNVLDNARSASQASAEMLDTLLDFSRIEAGVVRPRQRACRLQPLLYKLESELAPQADAKGLIYRTRETPLSVISDPALLERIVRNLITNAIHYTEQGGLLVACRSRAGRVSIEVVDTGIGIAPEQQQAVFQEFHQLGNPERDRSKGLGLGLSIADGLSRSLGHHLTLSSRPGRGSIFRLTLAPAPAGTSALLDDADTAVEALEKKLVGRRLLVVDDDPAARLGMRLLLRSWGCLSQEADSLNAALALSWPAPPEAIICDYRLREAQDGVSVIRRLRAHFGIEIPALLMTGDTHPQRLREAISSDFVLMHKPVSAKALHRELETLLGA